MSLLSKIGFYVVGIVIVGYFLYQVWLFVQKAKKPSDKEGGNDHFK